MKTPPLLAVLLLSAACTTVPQTTGFRFRPDVLYFENSASGREAADRLLRLYDGRQEVAVVDQKIAPLDFPVPRFEALPIYPPALRAAGVGGTVTVDFVVGESGDVIHAAVVTTSDARLNEAALAAIRKWKFKPAQRSGANVRCHLQVPIVFAPTG